MYPLLLQAVTAVRLGDPRVIAVVVMAIAHAPRPHEISRCPRCADWFGSAQGKIAELSSFLRASLLQEVAAFHVANF
jgi:hypothetical protein